jgi:hypothetical protein
MPALKVERGGIDGADPWWRGATTARLIQIIHL